jgi:predicted TIM-barrel fold metal-dependent hydrolase
LQQCVLRATLEDIGRNRQHSARDMTEGFIDFHHHARPQAFFDALAESGRTTMGGRPFPPGWTLGGALALMDRVQIATAVLSAPDADLLYRDRAIALRLSRLMNELFAGTIAARPDRFGAFASLPMPHLDDALRELSHALDVLKLDGAMLSTSYDGRYLGSAEFDTLFAELDRREALVFVHPVSPMGMDKLALDFPASLLEYAFDTTRCIANLLRHRVPDRFPHIRFIFSHAGGTVPYITARLSLMEHFLTPGHIMRADEDRAAIERGLRSFYYDLALSSTDPVFTMLEQVVGADRIVFGSDYPQVPEPYIRATADAVLHSGTIGDAQRDQYIRGNGLKLVPRLAGAGRS